MIFKSRIQYQTSTYTSSTTESRVDFKSRKLEQWQKMTKSACSKVASEKVAVAFERKVDLYYNLFFLAESEYLCFMY